MRQQGLLLEVVKCTSVLESLCAQVQRRDMSSPVKQARRNEFASVFEADEADSTPTNPPITLLEGISVYLFG